MHNLFLNDDLFPVLKWKISNFIQSDQEISPLHLHEIFRGGASHALVCTQFICAVSIHLQGNPNLSRDAISDFSAKL